MTIGVVLGVFIQRADASSAPWMFIMDLRAVDGEKNKTFHELDAGALTLDGSIWVTSKLARATSEPEPVKLIVMKSGFLNTEICSIAVLPDRIFNKKTAFSTSCGAIERGVYFLVVSKREAIDKTGDGWHLQGAGTLVTK